MAITESYGWTAELPASAGYLEKVILRVARQCDAKTVLDAGCGNGALVSSLTEAGFLAQGVDGDRGGIEIAKSKYPNISFSVGHFTDEPASQFDFVFSTEVIEHLYAPRELIGYCFKALRPGGTLAISTPYHGYFKNLLLSLAGGWDSHFTAEWDGGHIKFWSRKTLRNLLVERGFAPTEFIGCGRLPYIWKSMILVAKKPF